MSDFTGSSKQRRAQGSCRPPTKPAVNVPRFTIPAGSFVEITRVEKLAWKEYKTKLAVGAEKYESYRDFHYTFRVGAYLIRVHRSWVDRRGERKFDAWAFSMELMRRSDARRAARRDR